MGPPDISVWFACKLCGHYFLKIPDFINHKKRNHYQDFLKSKSKCIIFEETAFSNLAEYENHRLHQNKTRLVSVTTSSSPGTGTVRVEISLNQDDASPDPITTTDFDHFDDDTDFAQDNNTDRDPQTEETETMDQCQAATEKNTDSINENETDLQKVSKCNDNSSLKNISAVPAQVTPAAAASETQTPPDSTSSNVSKCPVCGMFIKFKSHLDVHMRKHANEPPPPSPPPLPSPPNLPQRKFKCPEPNCSKSFNDKTSVKQHLVCHSNERPFKCSLPDCGNTFKRQSHLTSHLKAHKLRKCLFQCPEEHCGKVLSTHASVFQHLKKVHSGGPMKKRVYTLKQLVEEK